MGFAVHPLTPARWADVESVFNARGCSVARGCWCMYYRVGSHWEQEQGAGTRAEKARRALKALAAQDPPPGLIGYQDELPVGWVSLGPRESYLKLQRSPVMKPVDDQPVWSIVCFVVPSEYRQQGVARRLLAGAIHYARQRGVRLLEAYPIDRQKDPSAQSSWFGSKAMYDELDFEVVARRKPARPVVRLKVSGS